MIAFVRAASITGSFGPPSNQIVASAVPPRSLASSRKAFAESMSRPIAALAIVLAMEHFACSTARGGRCSNRVSVANFASAAAVVMAVSQLLDPDIRGAHDFQIQAHF